jgi:hypothetical protein
VAVLPPLHLIVLRADTAQMAHHVPRAGTTRKNAFVLMLCRELGT